MRIWLIHLGELLPIDGEIRLFRYGILAEILSEHGDDVIRWAPTFVHAYKTYRFPYDKNVDVNNHYSIKLLHAKGYQKNVSLARIRFHVQIARSFSRQGQTMIPPDIIVAAMPTPEMCAEAIRYAKDHHIPIIIDVRDLWPDLYLKVFPRGLGKIARILLWPAFMKNRHIFREATAITAVSKSYLEWGLSYAQREKRSSDRVFPLGYPEKRISIEQSDLEKRVLLEKGVDPEKFICCFFGQFETTLDLETVIDAARLLEESGDTDFQFVLCGEGRNKTKLLEKASGLNNIIFPGWVSAAAISVLMQISAVGLAAYSKSATQSLPNKPIEYLSGGLPIISSLGGELELILEERACGINYEPGNRDSLVRALKKLYENPGKREIMGINARKLYEERFTAKRVYSDMIDYLQQIISEFRN